MIHTDTRYVRPVVYKMTTSLPDKYIQLDTWATRNHIKDEPGAYLGYTYLKPVSYVSDKAATYEEAD